MLLCKLRSSNRRDMRASDDQKKSFIFFRPFPALLARTTLPDKGLWTRWGAREGLTLSSDYQPVENGVDTERYVFNCTFCQKGWSSLPKGMFAVAKRKMVRCQYIYIYTNESNPTETKRKKYTLIKDGCPYLRRTTISHPYWYSSTPNRTRR